MNGSLVGIGNDTADQIGDWRLPDDRSKADKILAWFNRDAFAQNAIGTFGTVGINSMRGPGDWNTDLTLAKLVKLTERRSLQFRSSFFNAFNHANLGTPNVTQTSPSFGRITTASSPRVIELGLKLAF